MSNLNLKGYVSNIQKFSVNDGEGIRTTVFLSGCPLRCKWCSNPETWQMKNKISGKHMAVKEVLDQIKKDIIFFRESGGGVTFSGGEPTYQSLFLKEIVDSLYDLGIHMAIETCGYFHWEDASDILSKMDLIFVDIKHMDSNTHEKLTGVKNDLILKNIAKIGQLGKDIVVRVPVIKGLNDSFENITKIVKFVKANVPNGKIELLPYHKYGIDKYKTLGIDYNQNYERPSEDKMEQLNRVISREGVKLGDYK